MDMLSFILGQKTGTGGSSVTVESLSVTENGTYTAEEGKAYTPIEVTVPQTTVESLSVTENGTYTAQSGKAFSPVTVNVGGDPSLPAEYQKVEYLENDGNCWCVITGTIKNRDIIEIVISLSSSASSGENGICGADQNWEIYAQNNKLYTWGSLESISLDIERDVKVTYAVPFSIATSVPSTFNWGRYKTNNYPFKGKMYGLAIYRGWGSVQAKISNLVPCYRKTDNVPGFYDLSNSMFYTNSGTGTFGIGPDVN